MSFYWDVFAVREEIGARVHMARVKSLNEAIHYTDTMDEPDFWPEGHDSIFVRSDGLTLMWDDSLSIVSGGAPSADFLQLKATFALEDADKEEAINRFGWTGGPDLLHVAMRDIGRGRTLVIYESWMQRDETAVHLEVYSEEDIVLAGAGPNGESQTVNCVTGSFDIGGFI